MRTGKECCVCIALCRFLWQIQYLVSQGFYVVLSFHSISFPDPNVASPKVLAYNWGALWRMLTDLPQWEGAMKGRVFPDILNEPR